jgi:hypothetical protein
VRVRVSVSVRAGKYSCAYDVVAKTQTRFLSVAPVHRRAPFFILERFATGSRGGAFFRVAESARKGRGRLAKGENMFTLFLLPRLPFLPFVHD